MESIEIEAFENTLTIGCIVQETQLCPLKVNGHNFHVDLMLRKRKKNWRKFNEKKTNFTHRIKFGPEKVFWNCVGEYKLYESDDFKKFVLIFQD